MNPTASTVPAPASLVHDVLPPAVKTPAASPAAMAAPIKAEVVEHIPVKNPFPSGDVPPQVAAPNPITAGHAVAAEASTAKNDKDLDRILRTVNRSLKVSEAYEQ